MLIVTVCCSNWSHYTVISDQSGNKHTFRSCSLAKSEAVDPCAMTDSLSKGINGKVKVDFCGTCETDMCNGASHYSFTIISVFVVPCFAIIISRWVGVWINTAVSQRRWNRLCNGASHHSFTIISIFVVPHFAIIISRWIGVWMNTVASQSRNSV